MPVVVGKQLESYRSKFFWHGDYEHRKLAWVNWDLVLAAKEQGVLTLGV